MWITIKRCKAASGRILLATQRWVLRVRAGRHANSAATRDVLYGIDFLKSSAEDAWTLRATGTAPDAYAVGTPPRARKPARRG
jgi:hypothetical protein